MTAGVVGVILAGGRATRMGGGKALRQFGGKPMIAHVVERLRPQTETLLIALAAPDAAFGGFGCTPVYDDEPDQPGPLTGIIAATAWAQAQKRGGWLLSAPCDTPLLPDDLVERLHKAAAPETDVICAMSAGRVHYTVALWRLTLLETLRIMRHDGIRRLETVIGRLRSAQVAFAATPIDPFENVNTPADLERVAAMMAAAQRGSGK
jgi:molybdopterin-guanine dinucleotide biosynthesis protein A